MLPSIFGENLFDSFFSEPFGLFERQANRELYGKHAAAVMRTDVRETDGTYELDIDLPGFKKDQITASVENGYLTVTRGWIRTRMTKTAAMCVVSAGPASAAARSMWAKASPMLMFTPNLRTAFCA